MKHCQNKSNLSIVADYLSGQRPFTTVGYQKIEPKRKLGEQWEDNKGILWEQKKGYKVRVNKQANFIRKMTEEKCTKCEKDIKWGGKLDKLFFRKTRLCEDCLIKYETNLRILGIYETYEKYKMVCNETGIATNNKEKLKDIVNFFSNNSGDTSILCNSDGFMERWKDTNKDKILEDATKDLDSISKYIEGLEKIKEELKTKYIEEASKYKQEIYA